MQGRLRKLQTRANRTLQQTSEPPAGVTDITLHPILLQSLDDILQELRALPELTEETQQATHGCAHCDAAFASEYGLRLHIAKMHRSTLTRYIPPEFRREVHAVEGLPVCSACTREFKQWKGLRDHLLSGACPCPQRLRDITEAATSPSGPVQQQMQQLGACLKASPSFGLGNIAKDPAIELLQSRCIVCSFWTMDFNKPTEAPTANGKWML